MLDIFIDTVVDSLKLLPFLFLSFFLIEFIEHKCLDKSKKIIENSGKFGPLFGGLLGAIPQCGFSVLATNLYITRILSLGSLIAIYLSTSDEMLPIFITNKVPFNQIFLIVLIKVVVGILFGFIIDFIFRKKKKFDNNICDDCDCEESLLKSSLIHTFKTVSFIFIITLILNILFENLDISVIEKLFMKNSLLNPFLVSLIGLIPSCGSSVMISELYINNVISFGSLISGLLVNSGVALLVLFRNNKHFKENLFILLLLYFISVLVGVTFMSLGVSL